MIHETYFEPAKSKNKNDPQEKKEKFVMQGSFSMLDGVKFASKEQFTFFLYDNKKKVVGKLYLDNFSVNSHYSFTDLYIKKSLNIVPIIAVDFSLANLTFDESQYCVHTLKEGKPNDYMDCLKSVSKTFHNFNRFMLPIGFGARTLIGKKEGPASNLFSMTGDFSDPFIETHDELINCYEGTIKSVQLALPVIYSEILKFVIDIA